MTIIFENVNGMAAVGIGIGLMTVVGQSIGAGRQEEAKYYIVKLAGYAEVAMIISCILVYIAARPVTVLAGMSEESTALCMQMILATDSLGTFLYTAKWSSRSRRCALFNDYCDIDDVAVPCSTFYLFDACRKDRSDWCLVWNVRRLGSKRRYLYNSFCERKVA